MEKRENTQKKVAVIMGSKSDYQVMKPALETLSALGIPHECEVISAHRTPDRMFSFAREARSRGISVIIAGAGGAAHVAGVVAGLTSVPVIGVPVRSKTLDGLDSLLSIVQMPPGVPVLTVSIDGAKNAALAAAAILATDEREIALREALEGFRGAQTKAVLDTELPEE